MFSASPNQTTLRVALGVALGERLPEEKLSTAARWTGQALIVAERLEEATAQAHALAMHGNELRKAGHLAAAIARLSRAVALSQDADARMTALAVLARAAGEAGHIALFDEAMESYQRQVDTVGARGMFGSRFTFREIRIRGLVTTGRASLAARLLSRGSEDAPAAPQWGVIEQVTTGEVLLAIGDHSGAEQYLLAAIAGAETYRLPHQVQRTLRVAEGHLDDVTAAGRSALHQLDRQLSHPLQ